MLAACQQVILFKEILQTAPHQAELPIALPVQSEGQQDAQHQMRARFEASESGAVNADGAVAVR